jgi:hypothetical protein
MLLRWHLNVSLPEFQKVFRKYSLPSTTRRLGRLQKVEDRDGLRKHKRG